MKPNTVLPKRAFVPIRRLSLAAVAIVLITAMGQLTLWSPGISQAAQKVSCLSQSGGSRPAGAPGHCKQPSPSPTPTPSPSPGDSYTVPASIPADCSVDVTTDLAAWIDRQPDGATLEFPAGTCYRIDETLRIYHRTDLTIEGNGATLRAFTLGDRDRRHVRVIGGSNITIRDLTVIGANPDAGLADDAWNVDYEAQAGFELDGVQGGTLDNVQVYDVWGDFVYIAAELVSAGNFVPSRNILVENSHFERNGRQGITIAFAEHVTIANNYLGDVRRATFDVEPTGNQWIVSDLHIVGNTTGPGRLGWFSNAGAGYHVSDIYIQNNTMLPGSNDGAVVRVINKNQYGFRGPFVIEGNSFVASLTPWAAFAFLGTDGITIDNNVVACGYWGQDMPAVLLTNSHNATVHDNSFVGAPAVITADSSSTNFTEYSNTT